jgi:SET domain-containing protein
MLKVKAYVADSPVHGMGLFAAEPIGFGTVVWEFEPPDSRIPLFGALPIDLHYGYINPLNPDYIVKCGDHAKFWNFATSPNCDEGTPPTAKTESVIIAIRDIRKDEELTISLHSDADSWRKMKG